MNNYFPKRLKELRTSNKLSQTDLAYKCGLSQQLITLYENGKQYPRIDTIVRIAKALNTTIEYLCGLSEDFTSIERNIIFKEQYSSVEIARSLVILLESNFIQVDDESELIINEPTVKDFINKYREIKQIEEQISKLNNSNQYVDIKQLIIDEINTTPITNTNEVLHFEIVNSKKNNLSFLTG